MVEPAAEDAWARFQRECRPRLDAWIQAERDLADARLRGVENLEAGDRLLTAEAALQTGIVDFAASQPGIGNPTPLAIEMLRRAEAMLDSQRSKRVARARGLRAPKSRPAEGSTDPAPR